MNRKLLVFFAGTLFAVSATAQTLTSAQAGAQSEANANQSGASGSTSVSSSAAGEHNNSSAAIANGTAVNAVLTAPVDSKKAKEGDVVNARTTEAVKSQGKTVVPKGTKLVGHVT